MRKKLSLIVLAVLLAFLSYYVYQNSDDFKILFDINATPALMAGLLYAAVLIVNGMFINALLQGFSVRLSLAEYTSLSILSTFGNTFLPFRGGASFRAVYLKKRHQFSYSHFVSSLAGLYVITISLSALVAFIGILILYMQTGTINLLLSILLFGILAGTLFLIYFVSPEKLVLPGWFGRQVARVLEGWKIITKDKKCLAKLYVLASANLVFIAGTMYFECQALGITTLDGSPVPFLNACILSLVSSLSLLISITPASLGIREAVMMVVAPSVALGTSEALALALFDRVMGIVVLFALSPFAAYYVTRCDSHKESKDEVRKHGTTT